MSGGSTDRPIGHELLEKRSGFYPHEPGDRNAAIGHEDFLAGACAVDPFAEVGSERTDGDVHARQRTVANHRSCTDSGGTREPERAR